MIQTHRLAVACFTACIWLEENAKKQLTARQLREELRVLTAAEIERLVNDLCKPKVIQKTWDYYVAKGRAAGVLDRQ